jgi:hypothetical protein
MAQVNASGKGGAEAYVEIMLTYQLMLVSNYFDSAEL